MVEPTDQDIAEALRLANPNIRKDGWLATPEEVRADPVFYHSLLAHAHTIAKLRIATEALNDIAAWREGDVVTGLFDEPSSAQDARDALAQIKDTPHAQ